MFYLALDTATDACSVATYVDGEIRERYEVLQREHTQKLLPMVHAALADCGRTLAQLDGIACGMGPGSFAGLRIGIGVVKGLALARDLPVIGVSSLAMIAQRAFAQHGVTQVAACLDARLNEVYFGAYRRGADGLAECVLEDRACAPAEVPALPPGEWLGAGNGRNALANKPARLDVAALPRASDALRLAVPRLAKGEGAGRADELAPAYLRDSVALTLAQQAERRR
jgi:tRNA threonylcarbamoyladenosine biosynthesis protein TsaB